MSCFCTSGKQPDRGGLLWEEPLPLSLLQGSGDFLASVLFVCSAIRLAGMEEWRFSEQADLTRVMFEARDVPAPYELTQEAAEGEKFTGKNFRNAQPASRVALPSLPNNSSGGFLRASQRCTFFLRRSCWQAPFWCTRQTGFWWGRCSTTT